MLIHALEFGGAQRSILTTAAGWPKFSYCAVVSARGGPLLAEAQGITDCHVLSPRWPSFLGIAQFCVSLKDLVLREQLAVLLTNSFGISRIVLLMKRTRLLKNCKVIVVEQSTFGAKIEGLYPNRFMRYLVTALTRWLYGSADAIVGVSQGVCRDLERTLRLESNSLPTIHNPVDADLVRQAILMANSPQLESEFNALARPIVITAGRMVAAKAQQDLLAAFALLPARFQGSLAILGDGPLRKSLETCATALNISDRVWMPGFVENPWRFIAQSDVFVLSSHWEGHPLVLLEALACGVPVVATDCPSGPSEILGGIPNAYLVPVANCDELSQKILHAIKNRQPAMISDLFHYSPDNTAQQYFDLVASIACRQPIQGEA